MNSFFAYIFFFSRFLRVSPCLRISTPGILDTQQQMYKLFDCPKVSELQFVLHKTITMDEARYHKMGHKTRVLVDSVLVPDLTGSCKPDEWRAAW